MSVEYTYSKNNKAQFQLQDINELKGKEIKKLFENAPQTLIAGCAPCQPFSIYQKKKDKNSIKTHKKYPAFINFIRIVKEVKPDFVTMENVPSIKKDDNFIDFVNKLKEMKYKVNFKVINIANWNAPQMRRRLILIASKISKIEITEKQSKKFKTIKEAIKNLSHLQNGQVDNKDPLHRSAKLSNLNLQRIKFSQPGGTWKDWPKKILPNCYKKPSGQTFTSVYGRLSPNKANTLTTQFTRYGTGRYGHYEQDRALSLREGAILQTFPQKYDFNVVKLGITRVSRHIGNALPPIIGKLIGNLFIKSLYKKWIKII